MKYIDESNKKLKWHNKNYFFATTVFLICFLVYSFYKMDIYNVPLLRRNRDLNMIIMSLRHLNVWHLIGNMLSLFVVSIFLERHYGSIWYLIIFCVGIVIGNFAIETISGRNNWTGESGTNYFLFALFFVTLLFEFKKQLFPPKNAIFPCVIALLIVLLMCWNGSIFTTSKLSDYLTFGFFSDLTRNIAHWSAFIGGLLFAFILRAGILLFGITIKKSKASKLTDI